MAVDRDLLTDLLGEVRKGDEQAFARLYDGCATPCYSLALRVVRNRDHAADVVQDTFIAVWRNAAAFDAQKGSALTWVLTIAHRKAVDLVRREQRRQTSPLDVENAPDTDPYYVHPAWLDDQRADVWRALAGLGDAHREILALAYFGGLTQSQIARRLSTPIGTVKSRTHAALDALRSALEAAGHDRDQQLVS